MFRMFFCVLTMGFLLGCQGKKSDNQAMSAEDSVEAAPSVEATPLDDESDEPLDELLSVEDYIAKHYPPPKWGILKVVPSNLLPDIEEESLVFLEDAIENQQARIDNQPYSDEPWPSAFDMVFCVYVADGKTQEYELPYGMSLGYKKRALRVIKPYESHYGPWLDYCYLSDVDGDGIQEAIIFILTGMDFRMKTYKFQDGEFKIVDEEDITGPLIE